MDKTNMSQELWPQYHVGKPFLILPQFQKSAKQLHTETSFGDVISLKIYEKYSFLLPPVCIY